jgi:hypothetical protein
MPDTAHVIAGRCTAVFEGDRTREHCGALLPSSSPTVVNTISNDWPLTRDDILSGFLRPLHDREGERYAQQNDQEIDKQDDNISAGSVACHARQVPSLEQAL